LKKIKIGIDFIKGTKNVDFFKCLIFSLFVELTNFIRIIHNMKVAIEKKIFYCVFTNFKRYLHKKD